VSGLHVAVPESRFHAKPGTGAGRVWESVMQRLEQMVGVRPRPLIAPPAWRRPFDRRPDVWLAPGHEGPVAATEPVVVVTHGTPWTIEPALWDMVDHAYMRAFIEQTEAALRTADFVIVPSEYARTALLAGYDFPESHVVPVHHGVDAETFNPSRSGGRQRVAGVLRRDRPYVLFASVASPQKNLDGLIRVMGRLVERGHPHALAIAGAAEPLPDSYWARLVGEFPGLADRVAWLGHVPDEDLAGLMSEAEVFCLPSLMDSFGLTALEALACGAPVLVSDRGALPEVVGDAAVITDPTVDGIAGGLDDLLADNGRAARLRAAGPERARALSWDRTAQGWLEVLKTAASQS
jgi:glycosyltransferase involved in cell wall biosynthesis